MAPPKPKVLFLCTGNACRSQMAEGWARALHGERIEAYSAGTAPTALDPRAVAVMRQAGVELDGQYAKRLDEFDGLVFDYVVTVCDRAHESCPILSGRLGRLHAGFDDPPRLARTADDEAPYRRVRDEIRAWIETLPERLAREARTRGE